MTSRSDRPSPGATTHKIWEWFHWKLEQAPLSADQDARFEISIPSTNKDDIARPHSAAPRYELTRREKKAILRGFYLRGRKQSGAWDEVRHCLESEAVTRDFRRLIARMIEGNILHDRASLPTALDRADTMRRRSLYGYPLAKYYHDLGKQGRSRLAERLVAFDLCLEFYDCGEPHEIGDWEGFLEELARFESKVKSICGPHRGTNKAGKGIGAEVLSATTTARVISE